MLPTVLAEQLQEGLCDYIDTTFPMTNNAFRNSLQAFVSEKNSVFHEPYTAVRLPFRVSDRETECFKVIHPKFKPYIHQQKAYERLRGDDGSSTLIATGTGSGKTECFLYPILDYCWRHMDRPGIKALIIYPMNALASDQAERIAGEIWNNPDLRDNITVGMYVGGQHIGKATMGEHHVITDRDTMRNTPPDILLTNYKMLDYLLVRPEDAAIWKHNAYDTLKYIAVDELHTFDGAQGTDLACLLRRLKSRLGIPTGQLCCIGTSATMGGEGSTKAMLDFAEKVFGEQFDSDAVITEDRLSVEEFLSGHETKYFNIPDNKQVNVLGTLAALNQTGEYISKAYGAWFGQDPDPKSVLEAGFRVELADQLLSHSFFRNLLKTTLGDYYQCEGIVAKMKEVLPDFTGLDHPETALDSFYALISHSRTFSGERLSPFLMVQTQVWFRELRRLLAKVDPHEISYSLSTDLNDEQLKHYLPVVNCRDCGETGWVSILNEKMDLTLKDLNTFYNLFFERDGNAKIVMVFPHSHEELPANLSPARLCPECLHLTIGKTEDHHCPNCKAETFEVGYTRELYKSNDQYVCPGCGSSRGIALIGLRAATAISACLTQLYASPFNDDKKALAFCDSVQDAAHHAGFFNARTWRSGFRSAVQRYAMDIGEGLTLQSFIDGFVPYWQEKMDDINRYAGFFTPPDLTWMEGYEHLIESGNLGINDRSKTLIRFLHDRLCYEIMLEYGAGGKIGRTLERTGCSIPAFNNEAILKAAEAISVRIQNEVGVMREKSLQDFSKLIIGFLHLMRSNGAYADSIYRAFITEKGSTYLLSKKYYPWLPGLRSGRNTPKFISERNSLGKRKYDFDSIDGNTKYTVWIQSCAEGMLWGEQSTDIACIILEELEHSGLVSLMLDEPGLKTWGLNKEALTISTHVSQMVCDCCGSVLPVADENLEFWKDAPCLNRKCSGHYRVTEISGQNFYGKLYRYGDMERVNAREHTGLLERGAREKLEADFKGKAKEKMPWIPNLLTCTPTLEMGIDIGDLSTVVLCSVPPEQSQFLQRIGRAGRKDGNALSMVAANARPHDSYFYADPMEMISGNVSSPRIFLDAPAVLERQFTAFCMDNWIRSGAPENAVPARIGSCFRNLDKGNVNEFPFNFLRFVENNRKRLLRQFEACFKNDDLQESSIRYLREYAEGKGLKKSAMHVRFLNVFQEQKKQKDALTGQIKELRELIKELESKPKDSSFDEEIRNYRFQQLSLAKVLNQLLKKNVFNFLSDEGLLPNYAFPESGIVLKAILVRKNKNGDNNLEAKPDVYEYSRSASSALGEFAPSNSFYAQGHRLKIDQIDMSIEEPEPWHLCPNCNHAEKVDPTHNTASCPNCHTPGWGDAGQIRNMLKVRMVYSNSGYEDSMISDDSDDRTTVFYDRQTLVDIDESTPKDAWQIGDDRTPFGYEYVQKATIREINFGPKDFFSEKIRVAGIEESRKGFRICKYCGKVQDNPHKEVHAPTCKAKKSPDAYPNPIENCLFLYRELETEILRILVPATTLDSDTKRLESFISAFKLGLDKHFGNVSHLSFCTMEVPVNEASYRKQMLVVYDSVPGGTGYLKQLMNNENAMIDVLEKALKAMEECPVCSVDEERDGCYHCLYSYRQSSRIGLISRRTASEMLKSILSSKDKRQHLSSLDEVIIDPIVQSELEQRFLTALDQIPGWPMQVEPGIIHGKIGYDLIAGEMHWKVEPQVNLGPSDGVTVPCCPDFVIWPVERSKNHLPVAVFTDGFEYHKNIADVDSVKREAIRRSGKFRVWSLSYDDVMGNYSSISDYASPALDDKYLPSLKAYQNITASLGRKKISAGGVGPLQLLAQYLSNPNAEEAFTGTALAYAIGHLQPQSVANKSDFSRWWNGVERFIPLQGINEPDPLFGITCFGYREPANTEAALLKFYSWVPMDDLRTKGFSVNPKVFAELEDRIGERTDLYKSEWNGFWHFWNLMQFTKGFMGITSKGLDDLAYDQFIEKRTEDQIVPSIIWNVQEDELLPEELTCAGQLMSSGMSEPTFGYELTGTKGNVLGECSMAWETEKIAVMMPWQEEENREVFESCGWNVYVYNETDEAWYEGIKG